jgi:hypothetical protein
MLQVEALLAAGIVTLAATLAFRAWAWRAARLAVRDVGRGPSYIPSAAGEGRLPEPGRDELYVLYFTTESCTVCRSRQEPALAELSAVRVHKVDALAEPELARRYHVYTVPTTVVVGSAGRPLHINYGYAPAARLRRQLAGG